MVMQGYCSLYWWLCSILALACTVLQGADYPWMMYHDRRQPTWRLFRIRYHDAAMPSRPAGPTIMELASVGRFESITRLLLQVSSASCRFLGFYAHVLERRAVVGWERPRIGAVVLVYLSICLDIVYGSRVSCANCSHAE